jgi:hypothetical protein
VPGVSGLLRLAYHYLGIEQTAPMHARMVAFTLDARVWLGEAEAKTLGPVIQALFTPAVTAFGLAEQSGALQPGEPQLRAVLYWAALQGTLQTNKLARIAPGLFDARRMGMGTAETLLRGWGAPPKALERARALVGAED